MHDRSRRGHAGSTRSEPLETARDRLDQLADEAERTGPITLTRSGRPNVVIAALEDWQRLADLASEEGPDVFRFRP
ncbi:type II toxin-antitoxin system prevent-host-death family antitoxin [Frankia coriariae]|uniref:type II toxin-antitoxin system prevent-host-death family antitoxin n=1 Tax=Protofrankia coriariae TaxID=1562887 RepID=UPI000A326E73